MKKLAIITSHPIQYHSPLFELLTRRNHIDIRVFYTWGESVLHNKYDPGFNKVIDWDIPLLQGYQYEFVENVSEEPGSHHFRGIDNPGLIDAVNGYRPDALLVFGWAFKSHLKALRFFKGKLPVLFRGDSTLLDRQGFFRGLLRSLFLKWVYRHIDTALYTGKSNYAYYRSLGVKQEQLVFAPHAIDNNRFDCSDTACRQMSVEIRKQIGVKEDDVVFLFAGKLEPKKDPALLIQAFLRAELPKGFHLLIVGNGMLETYLKNLAAGCEQIHFIGFQNQGKMPAVYQAADIFVLPSRGPGETWGLAVNEAMANGKPVVVSDACGCASDLVINETNGYVFHAGSLEELASCLRNMAVAKQKLNNMGDESKKIIQHYTIEILAEAVEKAVAGIN